MNERKSKDKKSGVYRSDVVYSGKCSLGCRKSNVESYASAEEAKQAMSQCRTFLVEGDLDEVNQEGNILADGKIAGRLKETGILNTKWTVSVDGKTWFWMKFVTDEPINNIDGVIADNLWLL